MEKVMREDGKVNMIFHFRHTPFLASVPNEGLKKMKDMKNMKWTIISKGDGVVDRWNAKQWIKRGVRVITGVDRGADRRVIMNDYVIDIYNPEAAIRGWDEMYKAKDVKDIDMSSLTENLLNSKFKTVMIITKDKELANLLR